VDDGGQRFAWRSTIVTARSDLSWQDTGRPASFTNSLLEEPVCEVDRRIVQRARQRIPEADVLSGAGSMTRSPTLERSMVLRNRPNRNATGTASFATMPA
jgi:hypothetical protein